MKLKPEHLLYVRSMGKLLRVTSLFTSDDEANKHMERHTDEGVVAVFGTYVLLAHLWDKGENFTRAAEDS